MEAQAIATSVRWTHPSLAHFSGTDNPVVEILKRAQALALEAIEAGWHGPPYDPFALAEYLKIPTIPKDDVADARTVPIGPEKVRIEYNPLRPKARIRYSIAHEIAHTLFPDCAERIRNRQHRVDMRLDDWQLEMLCNIGAAEILMPIGSLRIEATQRVGIDDLLKIRREFEVSTEAVLLRVVRLMSASGLVFAASRSKETAGAASYHLDYSVASASWRTSVPRKYLLPESTIVQQCTGIGFTAKDTESWPGVAANLTVECVGIQPYPERIFPRVVGIATIAEKTATPPQINEIRGDATEPRGAGPKIIAHVVNDKTPNWGAGFARAVRNKWQDVQTQFQLWVGQNPNEFVLGNISCAKIAREVSICHMISQKGYGAAKTPTIRYNALQQCLEKLADIAAQTKSSIHMPRIGCGEAGGSWDIVKELINETLGRRGLQVTVYDLPGREFVARPADNLFVKS